MNICNAIKKISADDLLHCNKVMLNICADSVEELMKQMCDHAQKIGSVKESYFDAVIERERIYPTGLPTELMKVALPHTMDKSHVLQSGIFVAKLKQPVIFKEMGNGVNDVLVEMVFMLAVNGDKEQLTVLQDIVSMFTNHEALQALKDAVDEEQIIDAIKTYL